MDKSPSFDLINMCADDNDDEDDDDTHDKKMIMMTSMKMVLMEQWNIRKYN